MPSPRPHPAAQAEQQDMLLRQMKGMLSHWDALPSSGGTIIGGALDRIDMARGALQLFTARSGPYREILEAVHGHLFATVDLLDAELTKVANGRIASQPDLVGSAALIAGGGDQSLSQLASDKRARALDRQLQQAAENHGRAVQDLRDQLAAKDAEIAKLKDLMHLQETRRIHGTAGGMMAGELRAATIALDEDTADDLRFPVNADATIRRLEKLKEHETAVGRLKICQEENARLLTQISAVKDLNGRYAMQAAELAARVLALRDHNDRLATSLALRQDEFMQLERENEVMKAELTDLANVGHGGRMNFLLEFGGGDDVLTPSPGDTAAPLKTSNLRLHSMSFDQVAELRYAIYCLGTAPTVPRHLRCGGILTRVRLSKDAALFAVADILSMRQTPRFPAVAHTIALATQTPMRTAKRTSMLIRQAAEDHHGLPSPAATKFIDLPTFTYNYLAKRHGIDAIAWGYALDDCTRLFEADVNLNSFGQVTRGAISELLFRTTSADVILFLQLCERLDVRTVLNKQRRLVDDQFTAFSPFSDPPEDVDPTPADDPFTDAPQAKAAPTRGVKFISRNNSNATSAAASRPLADSEPTMTLTSLQVLAVLHEMYPGYPDSAFRSLLDSMQASIGASNTIHYQMMFPNTERIHMQGDAGIERGGVRRGSDLGRPRSSRESMPGSMNLHPLPAPMDAILPSAAELRPENSFSNLFKMLILDDAVATTQIVCDAVLAIPGSKVSMFDIGDAVREALEGKGEAVVSESIARLRQLVQVITMGGSLSMSPGAAPDVTSPTTTSPPVVMPPVSKVDLAAAIRVHLILRQSIVRPKPPPTPASLQRTPATDPTTPSNSDSDSDETSSSKHRVTSVPDAALEALKQRQFLKEYVSRLEVLSEDDFGHQELGATVSALDAPKRSNLLDPDLFQLEGLITDADATLRNQAAISL